MNSVLVIATVLLAGQAEKRSEPLTVHYEFAVKAAPADVWAAWTTDAGLRTFFAPHAQVELKTFGRFDIHFDPNAPKGQRI